MILYTGKLSQAYPGDVGWDLYTQETISFEPLKPYKISTGVKLQLPSHIYAQVVPRSGLSLKGFIVVTGTIDSEYRGEIGVICYTLQKFKLEKGFKVAQLVFHEKVNENMCFRYEISTHTERGERGFGSSDK
jgi:dUTP pyrophosphatase